MICKDDLVIWFKNLESYKRIDVMCTLLNLCLPFELRFLGTCLEELGRRDAQDLRGIELRVNNPQEFLSDVGSFQTGLPTDIKIRRKMALFLALMRACNRTGVNELFKTLDRWGDRDFTKFIDGDPLQELLLVYTMATNHPVFSFEQRLKCGEIYNKILSSSTANRQTTAPHLTQQQPSSTTSPLSSSTFQAPPPSAAQMNPAATQIQPNQILMPMAYQPTLLSSDPSTSALALSVESLPSHLVQQSMVPIPPDFTTPPPIWHQSVRYQPIYQTMVPIETSQQFPPQTSSPPHHQSHHREMSQPSSPTHSRTGSPSRQHQIPPISNQPSHRNRGMRNRPSTETTPPPIVSSNTQGPQQTQGSGTVNSYMGNDIMVKNFEDLNMDGAISQLNSIRNGFRPGNTISRQNHKPIWYQQQASSSPHYMIQHKQMGGSESGSSGDMSPPPIDSAAMHINAQSQSSGLRAQAVNLSRLNGAQQAREVLHTSNSSLEFNGSSAGANNGATLVTSNSSGNLLLVSAPMHNFPAAYRNLPATSIQQRSLNGEINLYPSPFNPPLQQRVSPSPSLLPTAYPTNKLLQSCFNCGSINHTGLNCSEASMEDVTRNAIYKLDYTVSTQSNSPFAVMTTSASSGNLAANNNNNSETQHEPPIFIDLTQDTSSD